METTQNIPHKITASFKKNFYEEQAWAAGEYIAGVDEVGRGCSAGPVVAAAAILHPRKKHPLLKDSKVLTRAQLEEAAEWLKKHAWYAIGTASAREIDTHNIYRATQKAMCRALAQLWAITPQKPSKILVDAMPLIVPGLDSPILYFIKGEQKSTSIAAASIIAKVYRDRLMESLAPSFPAYGLEKHKGYATAFHQQAISGQGVTIIHRTTFMQRAEDDVQQTLLC